MSQLQVTKITTVDNTTPLILATGNSGGGQIIIQSANTDIMFSGNINFSNQFTGDGSGFFLPTSNVANMAYNTANTAYASINSNWTVTNALYSVANAAFASANNVAPQVTPSYNTANAAFSVVNTAYASINSNWTVTNTVYGVANAAFASANNVGPQIAPTYNTANAAYGTANAAYAAANTKFSSSGGTISGAVEITADLTVHGNTRFVDQQTLQVGDPLIYLAANNYASDVVDIGFVANYVNATSSNVHTGLFRSSGTKEYYLFQGYDKEPINNYIDPTGNNITMAVLNSTVRTSNLILGGANALGTIASVYGQVNTNSTILTSAYGTTNTAYASINSNWTVTNTVYGVANAAYNAANNVNLSAPFNVANAAFGKANAALANTSGVYTAGDLNVSGSLNIRGSSGIIDLTSSSTPGVYKNTAARLDFTSAGDKVANNPFWLGYHFATKDTITQSGVNTFPRASFYYTYTTPTDPTDLQFVLELGNAGSSTPHGLSFRSASTGASNITMWTAGTERLRIDSTGNVGIGTSAPNLKLEVNGNMSVLNSIEFTANFTSDYTVTTNRNALCAGPVTVQNGVTVTVPTGSTFTVV